ncbi:MAG: sensor histidine kinase, partial [Stellaceae bacterium]
LEALNSGLARRYIVKPWTREEVLSALDACLEVYRLREQKLELENRLFQAERFVTLGAIAAGIFHDMSQPTLVIGTSLDPETLADPVALEDVKIASRQLDALVRGGKQFLMHRPATEEKGDTAAAVKAAISLCQARIRHDGVELGREVEERLPSTKLSTSSMIQILVNLLVNASQALPKGKKATVVLIARPENGGVRLAVRDTGAGMSAEVLAKVRQPFFTTKPPGEGTGLGLFTCERLAREAGGRLEIESREGQGTTVAIWLPAES